MSWVQDSLYKNFWDEEVEKNGHLVTLDYSSPSALWITLHQHYQPFAIFCVLYVALVVFYIITSLFFIFVEKAGWFHKYKLNPKPTSSEEYWHCFLGLLLNFGLVIPVLNISGWPVLKQIGLSWKNEFPSLPMFLFHIVLCLFLEDFGHYCLHRCLHIRSLYPLIHKVHHEYPAPFAMSATYAHPIETMILGLATFYPAVVVPDFHLFTFYVWVLLRSFDANVEHCGYDVTRNFRTAFYGGTAFHDKHHTSFNYNFASRFTYLDRLFGTYRDFDDPVIVDPVTKDE